MTTSSDNAAQTAMNWIPAAFDSMGRKQYEAAFAMQKELLDTFEQMNRAWFNRAQSEIDLAAEFIGKVAGTRSIPDMANACQECVSRQLEMLAEDSRRILEDGEKLLRAGTRHLSNGSSGESASQSSGQSRPRLS
jgi:hypothetical protein